MVLVMLNPSVADAARDDPTIARGIARARGLGFGRLVVVNLFGLVSPDPAALRRATDPVGSGNDAALEMATAGAGLVICAWGNHGALAGRAARVTERLRARGVALHHLGLTRSGQPRHPLYVAGRVAPQRWEEPT
ncbi:MAG: DUF1643 domain-containing protein [Paracoccaceae bacterium]|nr:MAG: DUF1643 domain-containing protein [Paracoccaceae bacterium]